MVMLFKIKRIYLTLIICIVVFAISCSNQNKTAEPKMVGVKIYEYSGDFSALFDEWVALGINTVFVSPALDSVPAFRERAVKHGIKRFLIIPVFFDPDTLEKTPALYSITQKGAPAKEEWVEFVCPNNAGFRQAKILYIKKLIENLKPDGISVDFMRYFAFWEKIYPQRTFESLSNGCFDNNCIDKFQKDSGVEIPKSIKETERIAGWILENHSETWTEWKCATITSMVKDIAFAARQTDPLIKINLHAVPWRNDDFNGAIKKIVGQDFSALSKYVDYISPMCYHFMLKRKTPWIHEVVTDISERAKIKILPSIQVGTAYLKDYYSAQEFKEALNKAMEEPSAGVVFWNWDAIAKSPEKKAVIQQYNWDGQK